MIQLNFRELVHTLFQVQNEHSIKTTTEFKKILSQLP